MLEETTDVVPSLLQDYRLGRPMEMDALIFTTLAFARAAQIETPTIDAVAAVARRLAADKNLVEV